MIDETDVQQEIKAVYERLAGRTLKNFKRRGLHAEYVPDREAALSKVLGMIPPGATVGCGDSMTLHQVGVFTALRDRNQNEIFDPFLRDAEGNLLITGADRFEVQRKAMLTDVFLAGTNAVTMDGKLVNIDGVGNRVAPMIFGPKKVIIVVGANKIVRNVDDAVKRIHEVAAPLNLQRHYLKHHMDVSRLACYKTGTCVHCVRPPKMCNYTVIIDGESAPNTVTDYLPRLHIVIVGEQLGL